MADNLITKLIVMLSAIAIMAEANSDQLYAITMETPYDNAEGFTYERFNYLHTFIAKGNNINRKQCWNKCTNITGINAIFTKSNDCHGKVISCTNDNNKMLISDDDISTKHFYNLMNAIFPNYCQSCNCLCQRTYDPKVNPPLPKLLDSVCLDTVSAETSKNFVVTGVRLIRLNNTLAFQIQQSKIMEGLIEQSEAHWVPLPKKCNKIEKMNSINQTMILGDVIIPENYVVTGVAFERCNKTSDAYKVEGCSKDTFYLTVYGHPLDSNLNLKIDIEAKKYSESSLSLERRKNLINDNMDLPIANMGENKILSDAGNDYVTFKLTELEDEGIRKFVIPYIDIQHVTHPDYPSVVHGVGLYYKGAEGYGGYLAPSIFVYKS